MRKVLLLGVILSIMACISANPIRRAEKKMKVFDYAKAAQILSKSVSKTRYKEAAMPMLAECYRMQRQFRRAKTWYERSINQPSVDTKSYFYYALALRSTGDYGLAKEYFLKYNQLTQDKLSYRNAYFCDSVLGRWQTIPPYFEIKNIATLNTESSEFGPCYYDGRVYFTSDRGKSNMESSTYGWTGRGYLDVMFCEPQKGQDFTGTLKKPVLAKEGFNQQYHDGPLAFWNDEVYITRSFKSRKAKKEDDIKTNHLMIFYAKKNPNGNWGSFQPFFLNNTTYSVGHPAISTDGQTLYFVSDMPGGLGGRDLWLCKRSGDTWSAPENLGPDVNTEADEMFPTIANDGGLYFSSDGLPGYGGLDIFYTKQDSLGKWRMPENLYPPINSSEDDFSMCEIPDTTYGFFSSDRNGGKGSDDIYFFKRIRPREVEKKEEVKPEPPAPRPLLIYITGLVKDKKTMKPLAGSTVFLLNSKTHEVNILKTDVVGRYTSMPIDTNVSYVIKAMQTDYVADCRYFPTLSRQPGDTLLQARDLLLERLEVGKTFRIDNIYYDFNKWNIREDAKVELDKLVRIMKENMITIELGSHTDSRGSDSYNMTLSQKRAESAVSYIISQGIAPNRIIAKGYGESQLINRCANGVNCSPEEHQANRRTEFKVISYDEKQTTPNVFDHNLFKQGDKRMEPDFPETFFKDCK